MNKDLLWKILHIESSSYHCEAMLEFLAKYAKEKGYDGFYDTPTGNYYMTKGASKTYPCVVAHVDTVHKITGHGISLVTFGNKVTGFDGIDMEQTGIGGDDKCGIYAALHCMEALPACKAAFFVDEEVGCKGSKHCYMKFFKDCRFVLQADRRGNADFVNDIFGPLSSTRFQRDVLPIITEFGYKFHDGMMTDVEALRDAKIGISVANMSAGYYNPHSVREYIDLDDLENVCLMMEKICKTMVRSYPYTYVEPPPKQWGKGLTTYYPPKNGFTPTHGHGGGAQSFRERFPDYVPYEDGMVWEHGKGWIWPDETEEELLRKSGFLTAAEAAQLLKEDAEYEAKMMERELNRLVGG